MKKNISFSLNRVLPVKTPLTGVTGPVVSRTKGQWLMPLLQRPYPRYIVKRLLYLILVMLGVSVLTFSLSQLAPGDPAELILRDSGVEPTPEAVQAMRQHLGLDEPGVIRYGKWLWAVAGGDFGSSFRTGRPVFQDLMTRFPATIELTLAGLAVMLAIALPVGILSACFKNTFIDHLSRLFALLGASIPSYWLGLLLIYFFAVKWQLLPVTGRGDGTHLLLPAFTLGLGMSATYGRLLRASMLEILGQDYILAARARGLQEFTVLVKNALKNAILPVVTAFGMSLGHLLGGTVIVETIFAWPGIGRFVVQAIFERDYPVIQGYVLFMALIFVLVNLTVDLSYKYFDPRIRLEGREL